MPKPFLTYDQQIQKLKDKNLIIPDEQAAKETLHRYGYFALITGYKNLLKNKTTQKYLDGTTFDDIVAIYQYDEQLRVLTFRYLLKIERHIRSSLSYAFCSLFGEGQSKYLDDQSYDISSPCKKREVDKLINNYLLRLTNQPTKYPFIEHNRQIHHNIPLWVLVNALTFGTLSKMYEYSKPQIQSSVSKEFDGIAENQLQQILEVLTDFRNVCAHNERLFTYRCSTHDIPDLPLHKKPAIPKKGNDYIYGKRDYFSVVLAFRYMLNNQDFITYKNQLAKLIDKAVEQNKMISEASLLQMMGLPSNWKKITAYKKT